MALSKIQLKSLYAVRILFLIPISLISGCGSISGRLGATLAKSVPEQYHWIMFFMASLILAVWNYCEWLQQRRLQSSHKYLVPSLALAVLFCFV